MKLIETSLQIALRAYPLRGRDPHCPALLMQAKINALRDKQAAL